MYNIHSHKIRNHQATTKCTYYAIVSGINYVHKKPYHGKYIIQLLDRLTVTEYT